MACFECSSLKGAAHKVSRSEKEVSLWMTPATLEDVRQARSDEFKRLTSTDTDALMAVTAVPCLKARFKQLTDKHTCLSKIRMPEPNSKKRKHAKTLAHAHKIVTRKEADFVKSIKEELTRKSADISGFADQEKKRGELKLEFHALTDEA
jgi:hypothetical protein